MIRWSVEFWLVVFLGLFAGINAWFILDDISEVYRPREIVTAYQWPN